MTRQTFSTDKFIQELEDWENQSPTNECFPKAGYCPFEKDDQEENGAPSYFLCTSCPFSVENRQHFINSLKIIKLMELDHVPVSETPKTDEGS